MTLTKIAMTKRGRVALYADGAFVMSLHPDVFAASGISVGSQIDEDALRELSDAAELREARERALSMLSRQDYTARGLRDRLTRHVSEEAAGQAVERMQELGLIDDERYAARFAQELLERRHYGAARIRQELRRRGIDSQTAAAAASLEENDPQAHILAVLEKISAGGRGRNRPAARLGRVAAPWAQPFRCAARARRVLRWAQRI